ncbi:hypothetical protein QQ045_007296 [Rhodiola kirilowii]
MARESMLAAKVWDHHRLKGILYVMLKVLAEEGCLPRQRLAAVCTNVEETKWVVRCSGFSLHTVFG